MSMLASSRRVPHVDLEPLAAIAIASRAAILIFDLIGVRKSKPRGSPRLLHVENRKNQNPVSSGRVRTAGRASDINQCFFKIRTSTENLGFCSRKSKEIKTRGGAARLIYFWKSKTPRKSRVSSKKISNKSNNSNADVRRPGTRAAPEANLIFYQVWKNQVSAETLGAFQVGNQEIKFEHSGGSAIRPSHIRGFRPDEIVFDTDRTFRLDQLRDRIAHV